MKIYYEWKTELKEPEEVTEIKTKNYATDGNNNKMPISDWYQWNDGRMTRFSIMSEMQLQQKDYVKYMKRHIV